MTAVPTPSSELLSYWAPYAIWNSDKVFRETTFIGCIVRILQRHPVHVSQGIQSADG
ncbi:hypothetical protein FIBSPDRAFT_857154, partial [Athelia psychrophila]